MSLNFKNKKGMMHRQTCDYAKTQNRLLDAGRLLNERETGSSGSGTLMMKQER